MKCRGIIVPRLKVDYLTFDEEGFATILVRDRIMYCTMRQEGFIILLSSVDYSAL